MQRHLLWTGGWDSTFRLLDLVLTHGLAPHTHYLVDKSRPSTTKEIETTEIIWQELEKKGAHLPPLRIWNVADLPTDPQVTKWASALRKQGPLGSQYEWLRAYALQIQQPLELSIHVDDRAAVFVEPYSEFVEDGASGYWQLREGAPAELALFDVFRFPLLSMTKVEMQQRAQESGFAELLELTWFCHTPLRGQPCGVCDPCRFTIDEGLARRVPLANRVTAWFRLPAKKLLKSAKSALRRS